MSKTKELAIGYLNNELNMARELAKQYPDSLYFKSRVELWKRWLKREKQYVEMPTKE